MRLFLILIVALSFFCRAEEVQAEIEKPNNSQSGIVNSQDDGAGGTRGIAVTKKDTVAGVKGELKGYNFENLHALVIGVNEYKHWRKLGCAVQDANAFATVLVNNYKYPVENVHRLFDDDATRKNILQKVDMLQQNLTKDDSLIIYYAGHGWVDGSGNGFWIPVEAPTGSKFDYVSNQNLYNSYLKKIKAKHMLVIADSCFAGALFRTRSASGVDAEPRAESLPVGFSKASRWLMTSGDLEQVGDDMGFGHSPFAYELIKAMQEPPNTTFGIRDLFYYLTKSKNARKVQAEACSQMSMHEPGGEYTFAYYECPNPVKLPDVIGIEFRIKSIDKKLTGIQQAISAETMAKSSVDEIKTTIFKSFDIYKNSIAELKLLAKPKNNAEKYYVDELNAKFEELKFFSNINRTRALKHLNEVISSHANARKEYIKGLVPSSVLLSIYDLEILDTMGLPQTVSKRIQKDLYSFAIKYYLSKTKINHNYKSSLRKWVVESVKRLDCSIFDLNLTDAEKKELPEAMLPVSLKVLKSVDHESNNYFFRAFPREAVNSQGMEFVLVSPGVFQMGSEEPANYKMNKPVHKVTITNPLYLGKFEVSFGEFRKFMRVPGHKLEPVHSQEFKKIIEFTEWLNVNQNISFPAEAGKELDVTTYKIDTTDELYRLPTEAEWEYASRYPLNYNDGTAWFLQNSKTLLCRRNELVERKVKPDYWGAYFMSGNVSEYVLDWFRPYLKYDSENPLVLFDASYSFGGLETPLILRGGNIKTDQNASSALKTYRKPVSPDAKVKYAGFRLCIPTRYDKKLEIKEVPVYTSK